MKKILIVDDESQFCEFVKCRLESGGYNVITAIDGLEGVARAESEQPDIIFMDVMMPNMNGGDAVRLLKKNPQTSAIPVIFLTAALSKQEEDYGQQINIDGQFFPAIAKPFESAKFIARIKDIFGE